MLLNGLDRLLWAAGILGHLLLLVVLFSKRRARRFPFFTALIANSVLRTVVLFLARSSESSYAVLYVVGSLVDTSLELCVVYEVAWYTFRPLGRWAPDTRSGLYFLVSASLAVAGGMAWMATSGSSSWPSAILLKTDLFTSTLVCELFLGMVVLSVTAGLPWKTHVARIAHGLGIYALLDVGIAAGHTLYGPDYKPSVNQGLTYTRMVLYLFCLGYWIVTLWQEAPEPRTLSDEARRNLRSLQARIAYDLYSIRNWRKP